MHFEHFIITRFNLRRPDWSATKNGTKVLTTEWLNHRLELFNNYCFPSVKSQTNRNFTWLVFFDSETPQHVKAEIDQLQQSFSNFQPVYVTDMNDFLPSIQSKLRASSATHIISTRLDNDDAIAIDFVETIQQQFTTQEFEAIDLVTGFTLQLSAAGVYFGIKKQLNNPFISLIERNTASLKSVWHISHAAWKRVAQVKRIYDKQLWLAVIHDQNKVNQFDASKSYPIDQALDKFGLPSSTKTRLISQSVPASKWRTRLLKNKLRDIDHYYFTKLKMKLRLWLRS